jgi:hypothetical protein
MQTIVTILFAVLILVISSFLGGLAVWILWNWLMPEIFNLKVITYWQAFGLCFLSGILFKDGPSSSK